MLMKNIMLALAIGFAVAGCATPSLTMDVDYDTATDFAAQKTFAWMPATGNAAANELLVKRIRASVDQQLQAKGRVPAADNPNFLIAMDLSGKTTYGGSTGVGVSVGIPVGRAGRVSVGGGKSKAIETKEGQLVLHFLDAKTKSLFWQATASGAVEPGATPEEQQKRINDVIAQMLAQFPPKK
jgi:NAD(P)H-dependent FMN reductase